MANGSILGQMIDAAMRNGGVLGAGKSSGGMGGLEDILGQVLGGQSPSRRSGGDGGIGDILGQVLGGQAPSGRSAGGGGLGDILGQVLGGQAQGGSGQLPGGLGDILGTILGGQAGTPRQTGGASGTGRSTGKGGGIGGFSDIMKEFDTGGASSSRAAPERQPEIEVARPSAPASAPQGGDAKRDLIKYGGLAIFGMIAWKALQNWQAGKAGQAGGAGTTLDPAGFDPAHVPGGAEALSGVLVKAMIAATQADGMVDREEQGKILGRLDQAGMSAEDRATVSASLATPVDASELVKAAVTPEIAAQIYTASVMAISIDKPAERTYLDRLAVALKLDPGLKANIEATLGKA